MARGQHDPDDDLDDDAPWLAEGVRETRGSTMVPRGRVIGGGLVAIALIVLIGLGIYLISARKQDGSSGFKRAEDAPLIAADPGPYKLTPTDPGGASVAGITDSIAAAGRGDDPGSAIDTTATPEEPLARPGTAPEPPTDLLPPAAAPVAAPPAPVAAPPAKVVAAPVKVVPAPIVPPAKVAPAPVVPPVKIAAAPVVPPVADKPKPKPVKPAAAFDPSKPVDLLAETTPPKPAKASGGSASLQLGAFSSAAKADAAWTAAVGHAPALAALSKRVEPIDRDGKTLYRLRAGGVASKAAASDLCAKVKAGGDACLVAE
ncbi:SPOR domain-containing protein [Glacieibacterium megasporae]|uniref:SPOR domain-containing protein n=1 Tax=Glacieibacterium megasporae TaxID=2835787 RepID=UPI001C1E244C|nr:SPOR domain-containing protein [Polymorphobacter megasporae]UAJ11575.1 SPOR domain-containing protein [Polymorphobacter megasporae]